MTYAYIGAIAVFGFIWTSALTLIFSQHDRAMGSFIMCVVLVGVEAYADVLETSLVNRIMVVLPLVMNSELTAGYIFDG